MLNLKYQDGDLVLDGENNFALVDGLQEIMERIEEIFLTNKGEWFLDDEIGFARYAILGAKFDEDSITAELNDAIFQDSRIDRVEDISIDFDRANRKLNINYTAYATDGQVVQGEAVI